MDVDQTNYDAVVIGAGPSGSLAARELARRGMNVLLSDRAAFPRSKVCGCCLNPDAQATLARVGLGQLTTQCGAVPLTALRLAARGRRAQLPLSGWVALSRGRLDQALAESAQQSGAIFLPETTVRVGSVHDDHRKCILHHAGDETVIQASVVIAADGLGSRILSRDVPDAVQVKQGTRVGAGVIIQDQSTDYEPHVIHIAYGLGGYVGLVRLEDGRLNLAAAFDLGFVQASGGTGAAAARILAEVGWPALLNLAERPWHGTPPLTRNVRRPAADRLIAIGDAAGYVEPFTGDGMAWAMTTAVAATTLLDDGWNSESAGRWTSWHRRHFARRQRTIRTIAWISRHPWLARTSIGFVKQLPGISQRLFRSMLRPDRAAPLQPPSPDRSPEPRTESAHSVASIAQE